MTEKEPQEEELEHDDEDEDDELDDDDDDEDSEAGERGTGRIRESDHGKPHVVSAFLRSLGRQLQDKAIKVFGTTHVVDHKDKDGKEVTSEEPRLRIRIDPHHDRHKIGELEDFTRVIASVTDNKIGKDLLRVDCEESRGDYISVGAGTKSHYDDDDDEEPGKAYAYVSLPGVSLSLSTEVAPKVLVSLAGKLGNFSASLSKDGWHRELSMSLGKHHEVLSVEKLTNALFGKVQHVVDVIGIEEGFVVMPEGKYPATVKVEVIRKDYIDAPWLFVAPVVSMSIEIPDGVPHYNKRGEMDGLYGCGAMGYNPKTAFLKAAQSVAEDRIKHDPKGFVYWSPEVRAAKIKARREAYARDKAAGKTDEPMTLKDN